MRAALLPLAACAADLLPGERVLGDEIPAVVIDGTPRAELGASVALGPGGLLAGAPGDGTVHLHDLDGHERWVVELGPGGGRRVWWWDGAPWAWQIGRGIWRLDGEPVLAWELPGATAVDLCPDGRPLTAEGPGEAVACGEAGELRTTCEGSVCAVTLDGILLGEGSPGSAVAFTGDEPWWGDARLDRGEAAGSVTSASGEPVEGLAGDHVGVSIAGERAGGVFNPRQVPARARVVSLSGGEAWAVDRAAEGSRIALARDGDLWAVGVPGFQTTEPRVGRVYLVEEGP